MNINWKARFRNPLFIVQFILAVFTPVLVYAGLSFADITTWGTLGDLFKQAYSNPALLGAMIYAGFNAITDPLTKGVSDTPRGLSYKRPV